MSNTKLRLLVKYALAGAALGTLFPIFATIRELNTLDLPITLANIFRAQGGQPLLWLIDAAPIVIGLLSAMAGSRQAALMELMADQRSVSTRRTKAILDTALEGIITIGADGRILTFNPGAERLFGYTADEVIGENVSLVMPEPHHSEHDAHLHAYLETGKKKVIGTRQEVVGRRRDGTPVHLSLSVTEMKLPGEEKEFVGTLHDLSEEKRLSEEIERFFRVSIDLLCIATLDGYFKRVNPAFTDSLGYTEEELLARPFLDFVHPDDREATAAELGRLGQGARTLSFENRYVMADGSFRSLAWNAMPYPEEGVVYAIAHDVTELKEREGELQRAKQEADRANRSKGQFLANMSHEIRTPMNGVLGLTDLALNTDLTDQQRQYLKMVQNSGRALMDTLNSILDFSKIEAGKFQLEDIDFAIRGTLSGVMKPISLTAQHKGVELVYDEGPGIPEMVRGDPGRLRQVLLNLVGNAVKFTFKGSVRISMEKVRDLDDGVEIRFQVRDTGIGIPADKLDHIFESFQQADGSTTRQYGGTGLGLSIASGIISMMGGELGVESEEGRGSIFQFTAPFANAKQPATEATRFAHLRGRRALVVDDNQVNRQIVESFLNRLDMDVESVSSGADALVALERSLVAGEPKDLAVLDVQMPEMDGFELASRIQEDGRYEDLVRVVLTSMGSPGDSERCEELGVDSYLLKPVTPTELRDAIMMTLSPAKGDKQEVPLVTQRSIRGPWIRLNVLVAEDNHVNQQLAIHLLRQQGHEVRLAHNGLHVLEFMATEDFDMILMDVQMPHMDGIEATRKIRKREAEEGGHVPIVAMTAHAMVGDRERCVEAGMDDYISKPLSADRLRDVVRRVTRQPEEEAVATPEVLPTEGGEDVGSFDREVLMDRVDQDTDLLRVLVDVYEDDRGNMLDAIEAAISAEDAGALETTAHAIKGALGAFGAKSAWDLAQGLEVMGREGTVTGAEEQFRALREAAESLEVGLKDLIKELDDS